MTKRTNIALLFLRILSVLAISGYLRLSAQTTTAGLSIPNAPPVQFMAALQQGTSLSVGGASQSPAPTAGSQPADSNPRLTRADRPGEDKSELQSLRRH